MGYSAQQLREMVETIGAASPDVVRKHHADMGIMLDQGAIEEVTATIP